MTGKEVYDIALNNLGYQSNSAFKQRIIPIINKVYYDLHRIVYGNVEFKPINSLSDKIDLPLKTIISAMASGVAEKLALGEGDGELQQYFAVEYQKEKSRINYSESIVDVIK